MLTVNECVTPELLEVALERVEMDLDTLEPGNPSLGRIRNFSGSSRLKRWALECAAGLLIVKGSPEIAQATLGLLTAGILVGLELQKLASEVGELEAWYSQDGVPGAAEQIGETCKLPRPDSPGALNRCMDNKAKRGLVK
jgi:hypothetical protein